MYPNFKARSISRHKPSTYERLPPETFDRFESVKDLIQMFEDTELLCNQAGASPGHRFWLFFIGNACITVADLMVGLSFPGFDFNFLLLIVTAGIRNGIVFELRK